MEDVVAGVARIITIGSSGSCCDSDSSDLANLCCYVCLATLISVGRYVRKRNNNNNMKGGETGVVFWSAVYLSGQD